MNIELQKRKIKYIPLCAEKKISIHKCAQKIGITPRSVCRLKQRFLKNGISIFTHGNKGRKPKNKRYDFSKIATDYKKFFGTPFAAFRDNCAQYLGYSPSYSTVYNALSQNGIISPRARIPIREKKKHIPRKEREHEGDLIQIDGSTHDWLFNGQKITLHGAIDDATHKIVALYFCKNECLLGYFQLLQMCIKRTGGVPRAIYSDRASCFFAMRGVSVQEQIANAENSPTQWQTTCRDLKIKLIAAYSAEAKGRIERLWQTLQGRLPFIFRFLKIDTIEKANHFLTGFIDNFNAEFSVPAQKSTRHWKRLNKKIDTDFLFSVRTERKTKADGSFVYHGIRFRILAAHKPKTPFTICLSENYGLRAYIDGKYYCVKIAERTAKKSMPKVERDLIDRYFYADAHASCAVISA